MSALSKELEIRPALLYRWLKELEMKEENSFREQSRVIYKLEQAEKRTTRHGAGALYTKKAVGIFFRLTISISVIFTQL